MSAGFRRAEVRFAANLRPDSWIGFDRQVAQRPIRRRPRPIRQPGQVRLFGGVEKFVRALDRALQAARTKIILPAFHQRRFKLDRKNLFHDRNVLMEELFLEINGVGRDNRLFLLLERKKRCGHQVSERFADAGAGFDDQMTFVFQRLRDRRRHLLLFRAIFEILCLRQQAVLRKNCVDPLDKIAPEGIFERNHAGGIFRISNFDSRFTTCTKQLRTAMNDNFGFRVWNFDCHCAGRNRFRYSVGSRKLEIEIENGKSKFENPMRLLDRYIVGNFLQPYIYCIIGFLSIWLIFDISDNSSTIFDERAPLGLVVQFYLTQIPQVLVICCRLRFCSRSFSLLGGCRGRTKLSRC